MTFFLQNKGNKLDHALALSLQETENEGTRNQQITNERNEIPQRRQDPGSLNQPSQQANSRSTRTMSNDMARAAANRRNLAQVSGNMVPAPQVVRVNQ